MLGVGRQVAIGVRFAPAGRLADGYLVGRFQGVDIPLRQRTLDFVSIRVERLGRAIPPFHHARPHPDIAVAVSQRMVQAIGKFIRRVVIVVQLLDIERTALACVFPAVRPERKTRPMMNGVSLRLLIKRASRCR